MLYEHLDVYMLFMKYKNSSIMNCLVILDISSLTQDNEENKWSSSGLIIITVQSVTPCILQSIARWWPGPSLKVKRRIFSNHQRLPWLLSVDLLSAPVLWTKPSHMKASMIGGPQWFYFLALAGSLLLIRLEGWARKLRGFIVKQWGMESCLSRLL